jgi:hypothetical protein
VKIRFIVIFLTCLMGRVGAPASSQAFAGPPDACGLLSTLEVAEAVGTPLKVGVSRWSTGTLTGCSFAGERDGKVAILVRRAPAADWVSEQAGRMTRGVRFGTYREVPGIGYRSFFYDMQRKCAVLCVFGVGYYLQVSLVRQGADSRTPAVLQRLAGIALGWLRLQAPAGTAPAIEPLRLTTAGRPAVTTR